MISASNNLQNGAITPHPRLIQIHLYLSRRQSPMLLKMECGTEFRKPSSVSRELPMAINGNHYKSKAIFAIWTVENLAFPPLP